jgi:hypothetical protein
MLNVMPAAPATRMDPPNRGLVWGTLVSLLLHVVLLSLQFGIPGLRPGPNGALTVHLRPLRAQPEPAAAVPAVPPPVALPPVPAPAAPRAPVVAPAPQLALAPPAPRVQAGFTLLDPPRPAPAPTPAPAPPAVRPPRAPHRRPRVRAPATRDGLHAKVIAQDTHKDASFAVPPAASEPAPDLEPIAKMVDVQASPAEPENAQARQPDAPATEPERQAEAEPTAQEQQAERERLAAQREQERAARRAAEEQALQAAAEQDARRAADQQAQLLRQQAARYDDELASRQRQADEERRRADEALARSREEEQRQAARAAQQLAEQQRMQAEQARTQQLAEQERIQAEQARVQQLAEQQRIQAEQARAQQLAEQQRIQAEQARAQQLAEQQRMQAEQARAQQLAEQQRARRQAEQLAREQAEQAERAERLARQEPAPARDSGLDAAGPARAGEPANSGLDGVGRGAGALPRTALDSPLVSRARELLRGIELDKPVPPAMRPAEDARRNLRRALADSAQHDVPLRLYIDSIRQKIERNAIVSPSHLAGDAVRIFPIVSITVRSDGSIEDVTILRSSGRSDIDEVVRRIVHLNARYAAFPPNVAAHYDVVELRRVWSFAGVLRLLEEMR